MNPRIALASFLALAASALASPALAQTTFSRDTFTVAANTMLEAHPADTGGAWTRYTGNGITLNAAADNARNVSTGNWTVYGHASAPNNEYVVAAMVTFTNNNANNWVDLFGRASATLVSGYHARLQANGTVTLNVVTGGTFTPLATAVMPVTLNTQIYFLFSIKNAQKAVWLNGVAAVTSTNNAVTGAGFVGLGMQSNNANQTIADTFYASTFAPTAIDRLDATATRQGPRTLVEWTTAREEGTLGFRVHREERGRRTCASSGIIAGGGFLVSGARLPAGQTYRWVDEGRRGARYGPRYWIEELDLGGRSTWHGPIDPRAGAIDERVTVSPRLNDLRFGVGATGAVARVAVSDDSAAEPAAATQRRRTADPQTTSLAKQWELAAGDAIKIGVGEEGIHRVTRAELIAAGLDAVADLNALRLYADGSEVAMAIEDNTIVFYGRPIDTASTGIRSYWLTSDEGGGSRMQVAGSPAAPATARRSFLTTVERREKSLYAAAIRNPEIDGFVGPIVSTDPAKPTTQSLHLRHIDRAERALLTVSLQGATDFEGEGDHRVAVSLNGHPIAELAFNAQQVLTRDFDIPAERLADDNVIAFVALNGEADLSVVLSVAITYAHTFEADDDRLLAVVEGGRQTTFTGFSGDDVLLYDVTMPAHPVRIEAIATSGSVTFTAPSIGARTILALRTSLISRPASLARNVPSSLHTAAADIAIVTHPSFLAALAPLVELRRAEGFTIVVASTEDVYDEFGFSAKDPLAIRAFLARVAPRYALLVGDASFDRRNRLGLGDYDFVPTQLVATDLLHTASDSWLTDFDSDNAPDVPIGRLPVRTLDEAKAAIAKIVAYERGTAPASRSLLFVTDGDASLDFNVATAAIVESVPTGFAITGVDARAAGTEAARQQLLSAFGNALLVNYVGHGSIERWGADVLLHRGDAPNLHAAARPPVVVAMTCLNGYFHDLYTDSLAEALLRADGGAIAVWASSGLTSPDAQVPVNEAFLHELLGRGRLVRLGDAIAAAQRTATTPDVRKTFILFGDPATQIRIGD